MSCNKFIGDYTKDWWDLNLRVYGTVVEEDLANSRSEGSEVASLAGM
jgi:hypothetical protein